MTNPLEKTLTPKSNEKSEAEGTRVFLINPETNEFVRQVDEELIKNQITQWRHPDTCTYCAAEPALAQAVQLAEAANAKALEAMLPFFSGNPDPTILLHMFMSGLIAQSKYLKEHMPKALPDG